MLGIQSAEVIVVSWFLPRLQEAGRRLQSNITSSRIVQTASGETTDDRPPEPLLRRAIVCMALPSQPLHHGND